jgi:pectin methylesterase-like acyl-CoA thioesterase
VKFLSVFILLAFASTAWSQPNAAYYVATTGNDSNSGTQSDPWKTVQHAADTARAGSTVYVRGGIYEELVRINVSGNANDGFITFTS